MDVFELIEAQQKGKENTAPWMVGEQLKDICSKDPAAAAIVAEDLQNPDMSRKYLQEGPCAKCTVKACENCCRYHRLVNPMSVHL